MHLITVALRTDSTPKRTPVWIAADCHTCRLPYVAVHTQMVEENRINCGSADVYRFLLKEKTYGYIRYYMLSAQWFALMAERTVSNRSTAAGIGTKGGGY